MSPAPGDGGSEGSSPPVPVRLGDDGTSVIILDQTELPEHETERTLRTVEQVEEAIRSLRVRGAPLIGITAAWGVAALARGAVHDQQFPRTEHQGGSERDTPPHGAGRTATLTDRVPAWCARLTGARPTAVNLAWAMARMEAVVDDVAEGLDDALLAERLEAEARAIHEEDRAMCRRIGEHALELLEEHQDLAVLTHCNAGALATGGVGTALAPVYLAHAAGRPVRVFADETRPLLQGSRLTAWELGRAGVDVTVLADGAAAALLAEQRPDAVLVGADRIAANGDVANKVGSYGLAILARHHGIPFYVLAPTTTVDLATPDGAAIPIEHRDPDEVRQGFGRRTAPAHAPVWSPAFDVTPAELVTAIVTERGVHRPPLAEALAGAVAEADEERRRNHRSARSQAGEKRLGPGSDP